MSLIKRHTTAHLLAGAVLLTAFAAIGAPRPVTTPLADANLFISPCGKPYRSKPGEPYPVVAWFNAVDANHDGKIDKVEFEAEARDFFSTLDRNGDGVITDQEISYYERSLVPEINAGIAPSALHDERAHLIEVQLGGGGGHGGGGGGGGGGAGSSGPPAKTPERDLPREGAATYDHNFDRLDYDQRGYLTLDDLPRTPAQKLAEPMKRTKA